MVTPSRPSAAIVRRWYEIHKWTSLISTAFLLMLCITGLPLVFHDELSGWLEPEAPVAELEGGARVDLDRIVAAAHERYPGEIITSLGMDDDEPVIGVAMLPSPAAAPSERHSLRFDARSGALLRDSRLEGPQKLSVLDVLLRLHVTLFAGLAGKLFLGAMAMLAVVAIVSGVALYGRYMRRIAFGTVRTKGSRRVLWLDLHNLLGIVTMAWALVVCLTGAINTLAQPLYQLWQVDAVPDMVAAYKGKPVPDRLGSVQGAVSAAQSARPQTRARSVFFPSATGYGSPYHYLVWLQGETPLTARLFTPILVDAVSGVVTSVREPPWYLQALDLSRPLHFGDYGSLPLKVIWAALDVVTIVVLASGLLLWLSRRRSSVEEPGREEAEK